MEMSKDFPSAQYSEVGMYIIVVCGFMYCDI